MKRKRTHCEEEEEEVVVVEEEEEDNEEFLIRRTSLRGNKRPRYFEDINEEGEESDESDEESDEESEESDEEDQLKPVPGRTGLLPVTCGSRKGVMDVPKLQRGEECIQCEAGILNPPEFETFGGRGSSKKWKATIFHNKKPLQFWLEKGRLSTIGYNQRGRAAAAEPSGSETSSEHLSAPRANLVLVSKEHAGTKEEDEEDEDWLPGGEEVREEEAGEDERKEEGSKETTSLLMDVRVIVERLPENGDDLREDGDSLVNMKTERERLTQNSDREEPQREPSASAAAASSSPVNIQTGTVDRPGSAMGGPDIGGNLHGVTEVPSSGLQSETRVLRAAQSSDESRLSDSADLLQLNKEKIQLQLKVLKLQEEYYSLKIRGLQN
ncbi:proline-, glutamic acid- and leucine-rich protein 1-like [Mugil cephalus]|uniref:proline-, glutamic acid- and leucine-rich protein 1-like n=1 Tax=Mugil cephalus TaxID=48193 RepID=UPI001FB5FD03|nr:proline-, glutamic acid- and leucine-rich protein 1-like [Mugil cephalus]